MYVAWLNDTVFLGMTGAAAQVLVPSQFAVEWLNRRLYGSIVRTLRDVLHEEAIDVIFIAPDEILTVDGVGD